MIGTGSQIAAATKAGRPQVFDLRIGHPVWEGTTTAVPIDGDAHSILTRASADDGGLTLLDLPTGTTRWTAPDPGLNGQSENWRSAVTNRLVAVSAANGDQPFVVIYDVQTGRQLDRLPGWLQGAGDGWVTVSHFPRLQLTLDFIHI